MACLPSFYVLGLPKCGTTALFEALALHPAAAPPPEKESHFWAAALAPRHAASTQRLEEHTRRHTRAMGEAYMRCASRAHVCVH